MLLQSQPARSSVNFYYYWCYDQQNSQGMDRETTNSRVLLSLFPTARFHYPQVVDLHNQINLAYSPLSMYWSCIKVYLAGVFCQYTSPPRMLQDAKSERSITVSSLESLRHETRSSQDNQTYSDFCTANKPWGKAYQKVILVWFFFFNWREMPWGRYLIFVTSS